MGREWVEPRFFAVDIEWWLDDAAYYGNPFWEMEIPKDMWVEGDMEKISNWLSIMASCLGHDGFSVKSSIPMEELIDRLDEIKRELREEGGNDASLLSKSEILLSAINFLKAARLNGLRVNFTSHIYADVLCLAKNAFNVRSAVLSALFQEDSVYRLIHAQLAETFGEDAVKRFTSENFAPYITVYSNTLAVDTDLMNKKLLSERLAVFSVEGVFDMEAFGRHHGLQILSEDDDNSCCSRHEETGPVGADSLEGS